MLSLTISWTSLLLHFIDNILSLRFVVLLHCATAARRSSSDLHHVRPEACGVWHGTLPFLNIIPRYVLISYLEAHCKRHRSASK